MNILKLDNSVDIYKSMLEQVNSDHSIFISVLLGIVVILLGTTWWWNFTGVNKRIKSEVRQQIEKHKDKLFGEFVEQVSDQVKLAIKDYEQKMLTVEGNVIRSIAIQASRDKCFKHSIFYWVNHLEIYLKLENMYEKEMRENINWILIEIELLEKQDEENKIVTPLIYKKEYIIKIISELSDLLTIEKKRIINFVTNRKEMEELP